MSKSNTDRIKALGGEPATYFYFSIDNLGRLVVEFTSTYSKARVTRVIRTRREYDDFLRSKAGEAGLPVSELAVKCSSNVDFPSEYTSSADVIALCDSIRGRA
jgi:hypothetical protein